MKIEYLGHASFLITTASGTRIVTDPFDPAAYPDRLMFAAYTGPANVVTISHDHGDHGRPEAISGSPIIIRGEGKFAADETEFLGVGTCHDQSGGSERGPNTVFVISAEGLRVAHLGDLGHVLTADQAVTIGAVDIALIPVGGFYTIDGKQADVVAKQIDARIVIPMHYSSEKCRFPLDSLDDYLAGKPNVTRVEGSAIEVTRDTLPAGQQIVALIPEN